MNYVDINNSGKIDINTISDVEAVKNSLNNILSTRVGSVPGNVEFGCEIDKYLFSQLNYLVAEDIKQEIIYAIKRWEPRVIIDEVKVDEDPDYNRLLITVTFKIKSDVHTKIYEYIHKIKKQ